MNEEVELNPQKQELKGRVITIFILISIGVTITCGILIFNDVLGSKIACMELNGTYTITKIGRIYCNNQEFYKYKDGWDFERDFNLSGKPIMFDKFDD